MGSIVTKGRGDQAYVYLVESARVDGKPRIVDQVYLGTKQEVLDRLTSKDPGLPDQSEHRSFGDVAAAWQMIGKLGVAAVIDEVAGPARVHPSCSVGTYLALAICNRIVDPCSKLARTRTRNRPAGRGTRRRNQRCLPRARGGRDDRNAPGLECVGEQRLGPHSLQPFPGGGWPDLGSDHPGYRDRRRCLVYRHLALPLPGEPAKFRPGCMSGAGFALVHALRRVSTSPAGLHARRFSMPVTGSGRSPDGNGCSVCRRCDSRGSW